MKYKPQSCQFFMFYSLCFCSVHIPFNGYSDISRPRDRDTFWFPANKLSGMLIVNVAIPTRHCILHFVWMNYFAYYKWCGFSRYSMDYMSFSRILQAKCKQNYTCLSLDFKIKPVKDISYISFCVLLLISY